MTYQERNELLKKCNQCPYATEREFLVDAEDEPVSKFYCGRKFHRRYKVCKMLSIRCGEINEPCPLPNLTEEEIEERETEFDEGE